jgi:cytochrome P450
MTPLAFFRPPPLPRNGRLPPSPAGAEPVFGHLRSVARDPPAFFVAAHRACGDIVCLRVPGRHVFLVSHPDYARHVLLDQQKRYDKMTRGFESLRVAFGNGLLTSEGSFWLRQRRLMQPAFHRQRLAGFAQVMASAAERLVARWRPIAASGGEADVATALSRLTLEVVAAALFRTDVDGDTAARMSGAVKTLQRAFDERAYRAVSFPMAIPTGPNRRLASAVRTMQREVMATIRARRCAPPGDDLLGMLMEARDEETGERMSDEQLADEVRTLFVAGHETTANTLAWTLVLLSRFPSARRRVEAEARALPADRPIGLAELERLPFCRRVIQESLRLYPPVFATSRRAISDDVIAGYTVPRDSVVIISPYAIHRHRDHWDDPEGFDPDRFTAEASEGRAPWAYLPFGGGPHVCIGNGFALMEAQIVLATLAQKLRLELLPGAPPIPEGAITLRPKGGLRMRLGLVT